MRKYIFDVDGTLTPSRMMMDEAFRLWFLNFCADNDVYLVTGSDKKKTFGQIGGQVYDSVKKVYQSQGNDVWIGDKLNVKTMRMKMPEPMKVLLEHFLDESKFPYRTGNHIEIRPGLINFSIVGRNATVEQRREYIKWDLRVKERALLAQMIREANEMYDVSVAGETGIDIVRAGLNKSQILQDFDAENVVFFGDKCEEGGNDYEIALRTKQCGGTVYQVDGWEHTWRLLKTLN